MRTKHAEIDVECLFISNTVSPQLISLKDFELLAIENSLNFTLDGDVSWKGIFYSLKEKIVMERKLNESTCNSIKLWWWSHEFGFFLIKNDETLATAVLLTNKLSFFGPLSVNIYVQISEKSLLDSQEYRLKSIYLWIYIYL